MITRFLGRVFSGRLFKAAQPKIIPHGKHGIARDAISPCALRTTQTLQSHGYAAFIVGGAVRDLLLGGRPKDFDIATDATPQQIKDLFRNCRIIGRRFRLAHIFFGTKIIETLAPV